jgi:hypothetical protein
MTKQTYWIVDELDTYALVTGADERDRWVREGWAVAEEPTDGWVNIWHEGIEQPGRVSVAALRDLWARRGWVAGPPLGGTHPATPEPPADQPAESKPELKPAAGGNAKEK